MARKMHISICFEQLRGGNGAGNVRFFFETARNKKPIRFVWGSILLLLRKESEETGTIREPWQWNVCCYIKMKE